MSAPFPLTPVPGYFTHLHGPRANNVFYTGDALTFTLDQAGATGYSVRDWTGTTVVSGSVSGTTLTLATPAGGWGYGWYRIYLTGGSTDSVFGPSYGATNFCILRTNANFPTATTYGTAGPDSSEAQFADRIAGGVFGFPVRWSQSTQSGSGATTEAATIKAQIDGDTYYQGYVDSARPREPMVAFTNPAVDFWGNGFINAYQKTPAVNGATTFVQIDNGSVSGRKLTVRSPDAATVVETYDNAASTTALVAAVNAGSAYVKCFVENGALTPTAVAAAIGTAITAATTATVAAIYPSAKWFEGPYNESPHPGDQLAHQMYLFTAAVHAGNAAAKAIGPCLVDISASTTSGKYVPYFQAGAGSTTDGFSFHSYNTVNGQVAAGRTTLAGLRAAMVANGAGSLPMWQTELGADFTNVYGVYHPRRARWRLLSLLLHEQFGVRKERNLIFNDTSHGFWGHPSWYINGTGGSPNPQAVMHRVLNEELWGKTFDSAYTFGTTGDLLYCALRFAATDTSSVAVLMGTTPIANGSLTFRVTGAGTPTVFDCWGNGISAPVTNGELVVAVSDTPVYVRLPAGVALVPVKWNDWPALGDALLDREFGAYYGQAITLSDPTQAAALPQTASVTWPTATNIDRVLVVSAPAWSLGSAFLTFTVDTWNGSTWTTRVTVTEATPTSFQHGDDSAGCGTQRETYWNERYAWDVKLPAIVSVKGVRVNVTAASYGGEPDAASITTGGQGTTPPNLFLVSLGAYANHLAAPRYVMAGAGSG